MISKLIYIVLVTSSLIFLKNISYSHPKETPIPKPVTGFEDYDIKNIKDLKIDPEYKLVIPPVQTKTATALFSPMEVYTLYDQHLCLLMFQDLLPD